MNEEVRLETVHIHSRADELIACLEGEIAKRDEELAACRIAVENCEVFRARIAELEDDLKCAHSMLAEVSKAGMSLRAELAAINAQEPVAWAGAIEGGVPLLMVEPQNWKATPLYAAPVSEAKAQGVVMPPSPYMPGSQPTDFTDYELGEIHGRIAMWEEVKRLNAAPVQQVSVPDGWKMVPVEPTEAMRKAAQDKLASEGLIVTDWLIHTAYSAMLNAAPVSAGDDEFCDGNCTWLDHHPSCARAAAPAAPAADGWISVSERLPAVESRLDQECRAGTLSIAPLNVSAAVLVFDGEKVRSKRLDWFDGCLPLPYCITHWMPLPAAPAANSAKGVV